MTQITEPGFSIELPGEWQQAESDQPGTLVYLETNGVGTLTVMLLAVNPMYAIADRQRLLTDYMQHRAKFETGRQPLLQQSDQVSGDVGDSVEGSWSAIDESSDLRQLHRVVLANDILADFCYEALGLGEDEFAELAIPILDNATVGIQDLDESV